MLVVQMKMVLQVEYLRCLVLMVQILIQTSVQQVQEKAQSNGQMTIETHQIGQMQI